MSLNSTPSANRIHIGIFGRRNAGKSSIINAITGQKLAIVSDVAGTTTDPVSKSMELLPLGPVIITDTPGLDDVGELGEKRIEKSYGVLNKTDIALLVINAAEGITDYDKKILYAIKDKNIPYIIIMNKCDLTQSIPAHDEDTIYVSAATGENINLIKERLGSLAPKDTAEKRLVGDMLDTGDTVVLVIPIDEAAPKGRLILPQQQVIRDVLEAGAAAIAVRDTELDMTLKSLGKKPKMVITDSQAFGIVSQLTPDDIQLTSFSILFARFKGDLIQTAKGAAHIENLKTGDKVLICEGCTHHRQCNDIGSVKLPAWIRKHTGCEPEFEFTSGADFPQDLSAYSLIVHCGGCMLNEREVRHRLKKAHEAGIPMTNYGILIAYMNGILRRALAPFPDISGII